MSTTVPTRKSIVDKMIILYVTEIGRDICNNYTPMERRMEYCHRQARYLRHLLQIMRGRGKMRQLLRIFAHSATCIYEKCSKYCRMFQRYRLHLTKGDHPCYLVSAYGTMLKAHVSLCTDDHCGSYACYLMKGRKLLRNSRAA